MVLPNGHRFSFLYEEAPTKLRLRALFVKGQIQPIVVDLVHEDIWLAVEHTSLDCLLNGADFIW